MSKTYTPKEDSYLMSETLKQKIPKFLKNNPDLKFLETGSGEGINLKVIFESGVKRENIFSCDINKKAVKHCRKLGFSCVESNLFNNIKGKYDIIIFNAPYLPLDKKEPKESQIITTGGKKGNELSIRFLKQAKKYLNENGIRFLITSSLAENVDFKKLGYKSKEIDKKNLFFEKLSLWELRIY